METINVRLRKDAHKKLKILAAKSGMSLSDTVLAYCKVPND